MPNQVSRRRFLKGAAGVSAAALAAASGLSAGAVLADNPTSTPIPLPTATPAPLPVGAAGKLTVIHKTEYFEKVQSLFNDAVVQFAKDKNITLDISTANPEIFGDFTSKMVAAVQAGNPPDLGYHVLSIPQMYSLGIVEDVSDLVDQLSKTYGAPVPTNIADQAKFDGKWWAVPYMVASAAWFFRKDVFSAAGIDVNTLDTWDKRRDAALAVSNPDKKMWGWGLTVNRSGDGHGLIEAVFQAYGGSYTDATGKIVTFNSPKTVEGITWLADIYMNDKYKKMLPPGIESWTDPSNNEAYLGGIIAMTSNQLSIYAKARADKNPVLPLTSLQHVPRNLDGTIFEALGNGWLTIFKGSKNAAVARELILKLLDPSVFAPMVKAGGLLFLPAYKDLWNDELLASDPNAAMLRDITFNPTPYNGHSHPAKPSALIDAITGAGIPSQMMSNIISKKMSVQAAVKDAHDKIVQLFEESGVKQS